jgi:hypothetical protein
MNIRRAVAAGIAGLAVAGTIAGGRYANRQNTLPPQDQQEIEKYGDDLERYGEDLESWGARLGKGSERFGKGLNRMGKGLDRMGKGLDRMGRGLSKSFEDTVSD